MASESASSRVGATTASASHTSKVAGSPLPLSLAAAWWTRTRPHDTANASAIEQPRSILKSEWPGASRAAAAPAVPSTATAHR